MKETESATPPIKGYVSVNGLNMYYEIHGEGKPLVLLHGALSAIGTSFGEILKPLARSRQVIAIEQQAHGHTADIDRPLTIEGMAEDTFILLQRLNFKKVDIFGYSLGAGIALQLAVQHPEFVDRLVTAAVSFNRDGFHPGVMDGIDNLRPENLEWTPWQKEYMIIAPKPNDWSNLIAKIKQLDQNIREWPVQEIKSIKSPALIIIGDSDIVRPEHAVEMFRLLGGGVAGDTAGMPKSQLAILPGTSHVTLVQRSDWLISMISEFLDHTSAVK